VNVPAEPAKKATEAVLDREALVKVSEAGRKAGGAGPAALLAAPTALNVNIKSVAGKDSSITVNAPTLTDPASTADTAFFTTTLRQHAVDTAADLASTVTRGCRTPSAVWVTQYTLYDVAAAKPDKATVAVDPTRAAEARWDRMSLIEAGCAPARKEPQLTTPPSLSSTTTVAKTLDFGFSVSWEATRLRMEGATAPSVGEADGRTVGPIVVVASAWGVALGVLGTAVGDRAPAGVGAEVGAREGTSVGSPVIEVVGWAVGVRDGAPLATTVV
jgi:hypothetical protein